MITNVVADMQKATSSQVFITAKRASTKVSAKFLDSFKSFWFAIADSALSEGAGASKKSGSGAPTSARLDVELVKDLILRVTELVGVGQPDIRFASSLAAFEMSRAVLTKIVSLSNNLAIAERQHAAATGNRQGALKDQIDSLRRVISEMEEVRRRGDKGNEREPEEPRPNNLTLNQPNANLLSAARHRTSLLRSLHAPLPRL